MAIATGIFFMLKDSEVDDDDDDDDDYDDATEDARVTGGDATQEAGYYDYELMMIPTREQKQKQLNTVGVCTREELPRLYIPVVSVNGTTIMIHQGMIIIRRMYIGFVRGV